jgi:hypothetical protein
MRTVGEVLLFVVLWVIEACLFHYLFELSWPLSIFLAFVTDALTYWLISNIATGGDFDFD